MNNYISIKKLNYKVGRNTILKDINFEINEGDFINIIGPNGGGKSSLLKIILKLVRPTSGSVKMKCNKIGYLPQNLSSTNDFPIVTKDVLEQGFIEFSGLLYKKRIDLDFFNKIVDRLGLEEILGTLYNSLSLGMKQRVLLARAVLSRCELLLLDEPVASVDKDSKNTIYDMIRELNDSGTTVLMISHDIYNSYLLSKNIVYIDKTLTCHDLTGINLKFLDEYRDKHFCEVEILDILKDRHV